MTSATAAANGVDADLRRRRRREPHRATQSEADVIREKREHCQYRTVAQRQFHRALTSGLHRDPGSPFSEVTVTEHQLAPPAGHRRDGVTRRLRAVHDLRVALVVEVHRVQARPRPGR